MTDGLKSWHPKNTASNAQQRATQNASYYHNLMKRPLSQYHQGIHQPTNLTDHHVDGIERLLTPNTSPRHPAVEAQRQRPRAIHTTCARTWTKEPVRPDRSMGQGGVLQRETTAIKPGATSTTPPELQSEYGCHPNFSVTSPDTEALHTP